jgi:REP element-mobilizing transposase RayT
MGVQVPRCFHSEVPQEGACTAICASIWARCFRKLAEQKESRIEEGHLLSDHVHMMISIPPKYAVSTSGGFMKGKSAIHLGSGVWRTKAELRRAELLGARIFRVNSGAG